MVIEFGRQVCGSLPEAAAREWLVTDGLGGYAMGTVAGLRTRRYHGLLMVAGAAASGNGDAGVSRRMLGLAALDITLVLGDRRLRLATDEWANGVVDPAGHRDLESFTLDEGIPRWRWVIGDVVVEREVAMMHGRSAVAVRHRLVHAPGPVRVEITPLCTWRDGHSDRHANGDPSVEATADGFVFEHAYRVRGPEWTAGGSWYRGVRARAEAERGSERHRGPLGRGRLRQDARAGRVRRCRGVGGRPRALAAARQRHRRRLSSARRAALRERATRPTRSTASSLAPPTSSSCRPRRAPLLSRGTRGSASGRATR